MVLIKPNGSIRSVIQAKLTWITSLFFLLWAVAQSGPLLAQTTAGGTIQGRVTDPTGAVVPGVSVQITHVETGVFTSVPTDESGRYFVPGLRVGNYAITVSQKGFKTEHRTGINLAVNQIAEIDFTLQLGAVTEEVNVTGAAPLIETANATIGSVIENRQVTALPLNGRSYAQLAFLTPTVVPGRGCCPSSFTTTFSTPADFSIGGSRGEDNQFTVDGISATNDFVGGSYLYPSIDALQEFKIVQNSYMPDLGSRSGQVLVVSKAGTNALHGSVYEFLRNDKLDARNTFDIKKFPLRQNQFGAAGGGPIVKNKTFWFAGYEGARLRRGSTQTAAVPDAALRAGDFSELLPGTQLVAPVAYPGAGLKAGDPIPGNRLDTLNSLNPGAINLIAVNVIAKTDYPLPNVPGNLFTKSPASPTDTDYFQARIDHNFSDRDRIWGSYYIQDLRQKTVPFTTFDKEIAEFRDRVQQIGLTWNRIFRHNLVNEIRVGYNHNIPVGPNKSDPKITGLSQQDLGFPLNNFQPTLGQKGIAAGIPSFNITGFGSPGGVGFSGGPYLFRTRHMELGDTLNYQRGQHRMAFGIDLLRDHEDQRFNPFARGSYSFSGQYTGSGFADFLLGFPSTTIREINFTGQDIFESLDREQQYSFFAQDSWQLSSNFTLDFGLRYDYFGPPTEKQGRSTDYIATGTQIVRVEGPGGHGGSLSSSGKSLGTNGLDIDPNCLCRKANKDLAPRLAMAIRPFGSDRTVVRVGAGIFYARVTYNGFQATRFNAPWTFRQAFVNTTPAQLGGPGPSFDLTNGFRVGQVPQSVGGFAFDPNYKDLTVQQWSLEIQQQIAANLMASISYIGHQSYHGDLNPPLNQARPGPGPLQPRRPYPGLVSAQSDPFPPDPHLLVYHWAIFGSTSSYHALTALVRKQYSQGLTLLAHFTWSKTIDTNSSIVGGGNQDPENLRADRGLANFHIPRRFVASWIYELPFGQGKPYLSGTKGITNQLSAGWQITGILSAQDGFYDTPNVSANLANIDGLSILRPDRVCDGRLGSRDRNKWFDTSCFVLPAPFRFGASGRNVIQAPGEFTFDLSLIKDFRISEIKRIEFRTEFFNTLNHTNLGEPVTDASSPLFGRILSTVGALGVAAVQNPGSREIQFGLKVVF